MNDRDSPTHDANDAESNLSIGLKRAAEMAAVFMIGDGALGLIQAVRHVDLWRSDVAAVDALVKPFGGRPGRRRLYGVAQIAAGLALAASLRPRRK
ncbi:hypothetical protein SAMN05192583_0137 [Sphingomonas gellani]|uniref:Uncharacterized protein n=1 Tax=Sphingomonas gellani TaxID=1166340 RepID=A0A1H7Y9T7_9SPHN|nr:hypothetical protein [Sphingomonas gellani]SEM42088.1 hypothetical protein SAMN05192583_0137 [Sphingomonas gellani]